MAEKSASWKNFSVAFDYFGNYLYLLKSITMYQIREVFQAKPGKAKDLVKMFKAAAPHFQTTQDINSMKVLTDVVGPYWTVVVESETENMEGFFTNLRSATMSDELKEIMKGYMDCVEGGRREIFMVE